MITHSRNPAAEKWANFFEVLETTKGRPNDDLLKQMWSAAESAATAYTEERANAEGLSPQSFGERAVGVGATSLWRAAVANPAAMRAIGGGAGFAGGFISGVEASFGCGPLAPACVLPLAIGGGTSGAVAGANASDYLLDPRTSGPIRAVAGAVCDFYRDWPNP